MGPAELDRIRDQMKQLKRLCRHRTVMGWKQQRIQFEQALATSHRESMHNLEIEISTLQVLSVLPLCMDVPISGHVNHTCFDFVCI